MNSNSAEAQDDNECGSLVNVTEPIDLNENNSTEYLVSDSNIIIPTIVEIDVDRPSTAQSEELYRIVHIPSLIALINDNLAPCICCNESTQKLQIKKTVGYAVSFTVFCENCDNDKKKLYNHIRYTDNKINSFGTISSKQQSHAKHKLQMHYRYLTEKFHKYKNLSLTQSESIPVLSGDTNDKNIPRKSLSYEINLRALLTPYYLGVGSRDIVAFGSMLGLNGSSCFHSCYQNNSKKVEDIIIKVASQFMDDVLIEEISATLKEKNTNKYSTEFLVTEIKNTLRAIPISCSYDMGWQKRSTGKVFDSLSGQGYLIGCRSKKVLSFNTMTKSCSICKRSNPNNELPREHGFNVNWEGGSGAMELVLALSLINTLFNKYDGFGW